MHQQFGRFEYVGPEAKRAVQNDSITHQTCGTSLKSIRSKISRRRTEHQVERAVRETMASKLRQILSPVGSGSVSLVIDSTRKNRLARIRLKNSQHKNALSGKMMCELLDAVETLERSQDVSLVLVQGEGDFFCSGADLSVIEKINGETMCTFMQETTERLRNLKAVSVAVISGGCVGGGTELATACDMRVFASGAIWRCVHPRMGITTGWGGGRRLQSLVGRQHAIDLLCGARKVSDPQELLSLGLATAISPLGKDTETFALERFGSILDMPVAAVRACKGAVNAKSEEEERQIFTSVWGAKDFHEAVARTTEAMHKHQKPSLVG